MNKSEQREYMGDSKISSAERDWILDQPDMQRVVSADEILNLARQAQPGA